MSMLFRMLLLVVLCVSIFAPLAGADTVVPAPVDGTEDAQLELLEAQTGGEVEDIQGGLSQTWAIVGVVLVALIVVGVVL